MVYSVIVVDDEKIIRQGVKSFIEKNAPYLKVLSTFEDGRDAIAFLETTNVDLIISDIRMAEVDGLQLAEYIHKSSAETEIIIISGYKEFDYAQAAMKHNVLEYLIKPIENAEFLKTLEKTRGILEKKHRSIKRMLKFDELLHQSRTWFLIDLVFGMKKVTDNFEKEFEELDFGASSKEVYCAIISSRWSEKFLHEDWIYGQSTTQKAILNFFSTGTDTIHNVDLGNGEFLLLSLSDSFEEIPSDMKKWAAETFNADIDVDIKFRCKGVENIFNYPRQASGDEGVSVEGVNQQQKMLLNTYVNLKMFDAAKELFMEMMPDSENKMALCARELISFLYNNAIPKGLSVILSQYLNRPLDTRVQVSQTVSSLLREIERCMPDETEIVTKIKDYVKNNFSKDISLEKVAGKMFFHPVYLSRYFRQETGENFSDFLFDVRMINAIELLKTNKYKVYEISVMVGYKSAKYFSKQFKKCTGYTPKDYCRKIWNIDIGSEE